MKRISGDFASGKLANPRSRVNFDLLKLWNSISSSSSSSVEMWPLIMSTPFIPNSSLRCWALCFNRWINAAEIKFILLWVGPNDCCILSRRQLAVEGIAVCTWLKVDVGSGCWVTTVERHCEIIGSVCWLWSLLLLTVDCSRCCCSCKVFRVPCDYAHKQIECNLVHNLTDEHSHWLTRLCSLLRCHSNRDTIFPPVWFIFNILLNLGIDAIVSAKWLLIFKLGERLTQFGHLLQHEILYIIRS